MIWVVGLVIMLMVVSIVMWVVHLFSANVHMFFIMSMFAVVIRMMSFVIMISVVTFLMLVVHFIRRDVFVFFIVAHFCGTGSCQN